MPQLDATTVVAARGVGHHFGEVTALAEIEGVVERGTITVLLGPNGSGKTTLLRLLGGHLQPSQGSLELFGQSTHLLRSERSRRDLRRRVAYLSQHPALDPEMTVIEILRLLATLQGIERRQRPERIAETVAIFGLDTLLERRVEQLSGGQRRRLHLAAGLLQDAKLWLLDEPDAGLDAEGLQTLWQELRRRTDRGDTVVVVTHDSSTAEQAADVAWLLSAGRLIDQGPVGRILSEHSQQLVDSSAERTAAGDSRQGRQPGPRGRGQGRGQRGLSQRGQGPRGRGRRGR